MGNKLVDGGVADNQGIDALVNLDRFFDDNKGSATDSDDFDVLLVSDAAGQMELVHRLGIRAIKVLERTVSIFQFQLRRKMVKILRLWKGSDDNEREFAFVHLFLNLKGRPNTPRVPCEYIPALGRIRTDLDQFSFIEREALMYHGYTLIDAQIKEHCGRLKALICKENGDIPRLEQPPLFRPSSDQATEQCIGETKLRKRVKDVLTAGSISVFLLRSRRKYPKKSLWIFVPALVLSLVGIRAVQYYLKPLHALTSELVSWLSFVIPDWVQSVLEFFVGSSNFPLDTQVLTVVVLSGLWLYVVVFLTYEVMRCMVRRWDLEDYRSLASTEPTVDWTTNDASSTAV